MPSNPVPNLSQTDLKKLAKLLEQYELHIYGAQPLAAQIVATVSEWVRADIDPPVLR